MLTNDKINIDFKIRPQHCGPRYKSGTGSINGTSLQTITPDNINDNRHVAATVSEISRGSSHELRNTCYI